MRFAPLALLLATTTHATKSSPAALAPKRKRAIDELRHHINEDVAHVHLRELLADEDRCMKCTAEACGLYLDFARQKVTVHTIDLLINVARACNVEEKRDAMFKGELINTTENRAVLHVALRNRSNSPILVKGKDVMPDVNAVLAKMRVFVDGVRGGSRRFVSRGLRAPPDGG